MKTLERILESVIKSYNEELPINFQDLDSLVKKLGLNEFTEDLIKDYNSRTKLNFTHLRMLENIIELQEK